MAEIERFASQAFPELPASGRAARPGSRRVANALRSALRRALGAEAYHRARVVFRLARGDELRAPFPLRSRLHAWAHGFLAEHAAMYERSCDDFARGDRHAYLTDYAHLYRCRSLNPDRALFDRKLLLRAMLMHRGVAQPETVALIASGRVLLYPLRPDGRYVDGPALERWLIHDGGRFILKPHAGTRGVGVFQLERRAGLLVRRRGSEVTPFRLADCRAVALIERLVEQGEFWQTLSPSSANSIRVLTMWTPGDDAPFVAFALQRIGTSGTAPTDSWSGGGVGAAVDLTTGRLGVGRLHPLKCGELPSRCTHHPETGAPIEGAVVPYWGDVCAAALRAAASLPLNCYVGWDVLVDRAGTPVILEGNANTDINGLQVHGGLLAKPQTRRFYEAFGVV
jgi:hypothetical protein